MSDQTALKPSTTTEATLAGMWRDLGITRTGPGDSFFEGGGTSLTAIKLLQRVEKKFGPDALSPDALYANPRLVDMARAVDEATRA